MYRMTRQAPLSMVRAPDARSPFVRLRELLGDIPPGKSAISMAVGEPQHPIPPFVGPIITSVVHPRVRRYPMNKGLDAFGVAVAAWLNRRYAPERPVDPGDGSAGAQRHARRTISRRDRCQAVGGAAPGRPVVLIPNPFYAAYSAGAIAADCEPVYLPATAASAFCRTSTH